MQQQIFVQGLCKTLVMMLKNDFNLPMVQSFFGVGDMDVLYYK